MAARAKKENFLAKRFADAIRQRESALSRFGARVRYWIWLHGSGSYVINRIFFSGNENGPVKQNNQSDFKAFFQTKQLHCRKMKDKKSYCLAKFGF